MDIKRFRKGITTIIAGEIVGFITFILFGISVPILTFIAENIPYINTGLNSTFTIVMLAFMLLAAVGMSVSMIVVLCGLIRLRKKDRKFKEAIIFAVIPLILNIIQLFASSIISTSLDDIISIIGNLFDVWLIVTIIEACINISDRIDNNDMAGKGIKVLRIAITFYFLSIIMRMIYTFLLANASYSVTGIIISAIASVLEVLMDIFYIGYLIKVKRVVCASSDDSSIDTDQPATEIA